MAVDLRSWELENSFIKERISNVEKHTSNIYSRLSDYTKKLESLKDSSDNLAKSLQSFVSNENLNQSFKTAIHEFSTVIAALQDDRRDRIQRIDAKVLQEFTNFGPICKKIKDELKRSSDIKAFENKKQNQLEKLQAKNQTNGQKISQAEKEAKLAQEEAIHSAIEMSQRIATFERKKLENIKQTVLDFIKIEMMFYVKAIELYTSGYNIIKNINVDDDFNEFVCHYKALKANLDEQCLSYPDSTPKMTDDLQNDSKMFLTPIKNQGLNQVFSSSSSNMLKLYGSNSSQMSTLKSHFNFGDQSL